MQQPSTTALFSHYGRRRLRLAAIPVRPEFVALVRVGPDRGPVCAVAPLLHDILQLTLASLVFVHVRHGY